ncbi:CE1759 family FMN reductase [Acidipropionibacterium virtanenii]|uniref:FMN reductase (NADPH) n=1 Tax=Acidipropionibacterium virtanenii TaxID=2057246 RepID=A0A344URZ8_9ACTN|nr:CE1759 family FMN reductase [Acidipropionibacterium virtanenii]AXE38046.1 FMN reductase (NADPH) [Acidipropionibacterium virtanenii]
MRIAAISSGLGRPSSTRLLTDRLVAGLKAVGLDAQVDVVEVREHAHDLVNAELTGMRTQALAAVLDQVARADALVVVAPVFNAHPAGLFQMFFEVLDEGSLAGKPVLIGATGGTPRHSLVLDQTLVPMFHYLHALVAPVSVFAATDDWGSAESLDARIGKAVAAFLPLLGARPDTTGGEARETFEEGSAAPHDDLALTADFEQMMKALGH